MTEVNYVVTEDEITVYWERTEEMAADETFRVLLDWAEAACTEKTHCTLSGLLPDHLYEVKVIGGNWEPTVLPIKTAKKKRRIDITKAPYCAVGDGRTLNTHVIQQAIDQCSENDMAYVPAGIFLTGALKLHSDMELYLEQGAVLQGTEEREDYLPLIASRFEGTEMLCYSSLLNLGELDRNSNANCCNVVIRGGGTIAGGGRALAENIIAYETENLREYMASLGQQVLECEKPETIPGRLRPRLINMSNCRNVRLSGLKLADGASWNVHMIYSEHIVTDHCEFHSENVWNGDGWDPDSSIDCTIFACAFHTGDDAIAVKAGKNPEGNRIGRPCKKIRIFDCICEKGHGFAVGSEMSGGVEDVRIWDCDLSNSIYGLEIKGTKKRGGYVRAIHVRNCRMPRILFHSVSYNDDGIAALAPPIFEKCTFTDVTLSGRVRNYSGEEETCKAVELCGFDMPGYEIREVLFRNVHLPDQEDGQMISLRYCRDIRFEGICAVTRGEQKK